MIYDNVSDLLRANEIDEDFISEVEAEAEIDIEQDIAKLERLAAMDDFE